MSDSKCVFCNIYNGSEPSETLYKDDEVIIFPDIKPAAKHHYLAVTKKHIKNAKVLQKTDLGMIENLVKLGKRILQERGGDVNDAKFGFHWPPFNSISHLHLHIISPASQMSFLGKMIFQEGSWWFVSARYVQERLAKL